MSEKVLGIIRTMKTFPDIIYEDLIITPDRVIVARATSTMPYLGTLVYLMKFAFDLNELKKAEKKYLELPPEDILKANKNNFAIPNSEIIKVEAEFGGQLGQLVSLSITTTKKKYNKKSWVHTYIFTKES